MLNRMRTDFELAPDWVLECFQIDFDATLTQLSYQSLSIAATTPAITTLLSAFMSNIRIF